jgi:hypothetical protein
VWQYDGVKWDVITGTTRRLYNGVKLGLSVVWSLNTQLGPVSWDVEQFDTDGYFTLSAPTRIVIPQTGYYNINSVIFTSGTGSAFRVTIRKNGTTDISDVDLGANQTANYEQVLLLDAGDYLEVLARESSDSGQLATGTFVEVTQLGLAIGTSISNFNAFSGVRTRLTSAFATNDTPTAVAWSTTDFNTNANSLAVTYWDNETPGRITIATNGFYQINSFVETGSSDTYTLVLRKNGDTAISTANLGGNNTAQIDQIYELQATDYLELVVSDSGSSGSLTTKTYLEVIRMGV